MKKVIILFCLMLLLLFILKRCSHRQCEYCEGSDIKYEALFVPSGTKEYLCEGCYQKRNANAIGDFWIYNPVY